VKEINQDLKSNGPAKSSHMPRTKKVSHPHNLIGVPKLSLKPISDKFEMMSNRGTIKHEKVKHNTEETVSVRKASNDLLP